MKRGARWMERIRSWLWSVFQKEGFEPGLIGLLFNPYYTIRRRLLQCLRRYAGDITGERMLDLGCGSQPYRHLFDVPEYIGLDVEVSGHDHTTSRIDLFYDGRSIPFADGHFDAVLATEVFEHVSHLDELIGDINRVIRPGGALLVTLPFVWPEHERPYDYARYTSYGIVKLLTKNGFEVAGHAKAGNNVETIFQILAAYVWHTVLPTSPTLKFLLAPLTLAPLHIVGIALGVVLPTDDTLYQCNVVYCRKVGPPR